MFHVERNHKVLGWRKLPFVQSQTRAYCDGYVDALDGLYPSDPMRIVKTEKDGTLKVVRETNGRGEVHLS